MNIGQAAQATGISAKMIRHYESIGLLPKPVRGESGYRHYGSSELNLLRFVRQARDVGFSTADIRELLALWLDRRRASREVRRLAREHLEEIEGRIASLRAIAQTLGSLIERCHGDERPDCPILEAIAAAQSPKPEGDVSRAGAAKRQRTAPRERRRTRG